MKMVLDSAPGMRSAYVILCRLHLLIIPCILTSYFRIVDFVFNYLLTGELH